MQFKKATRTQSKLRLALIGPSGAGKTMSALKIARGLGKRIALIDTERGSASKYAGELVDGAPLEFDALELESFAPLQYVDAIRAAEAAGYDVLVIDSLSHAWSGKDGALEMVDNIAKRSKSGNSFTAWRDVTPQHNALVDALIGARMHVIATMRSKTDYDLVDDGRGKKTPRKVGLAPIQREGMDYEFDVVGEMSFEHELMVTKTRCVALDKRVILNPGENVAAMLRAWLSDGAPAVEPPPPPPTAIETCRRAFSSAHTLDELAAARATANGLRRQLSRAEVAEVVELSRETEQRIAEALAADAALGDGDRDDAADMFGDSEPPPDVRTVDPSTTVNSEVQP